MSYTIERRDRCIRLIKYTTNGFRLSRHEAAEVFIDFTEELTMPAKMITYRFFF